MSVFIREFYSVPTYLAAGYIELDKLSQLEQQQDKQKRDKEDEEEPIGVSPCGR